MPRHSAVVYHLLGGSVDSAVELLQAGADLNLAHRGSFNATQAAAFRGEVDFLHILRKMETTNMQRIDWTRRCDADLTCNGKRRRLRSLTLLRKAAVLGALEQCRLFSFCRSRLRKYVRFPSQYYDLYDWKTDPPTADSLLAANTPDKSPF
ncbi:hypothetical protein HJFPF1_13392 [Paramyrothecium foliicola]|nr:hypothetical protein HJFPF1_13392 [Paramyrothecium foliicola]